MSEIDIRELRNAFGTFMTGVTVVTSREPSGIPRGFTANSFTSVSLDPPLLLICIDKRAESIEVFTESPGFAISILSSEQVETSNLFASKRPDKFDIASWRPTASGFPVLDDACAWFDCKQEKVIDAGDHIILLGAVESFGYSEKQGLGYFRGGYLHSGLEQSALEAAEAGNVVVGALVDFEGRILLIRDPKSGSLTLPATGTDGHPGSLQKLRKQLGAGATIASLYAVFEHEETGQQFIYYRARSQDCEAEGSFYRIEDIPWEEFDSEPLTVMLKRYCSERERQRYGIYFGSDKGGRVKTISQDSE